MTRYEALGRAQPVIPPNLYSADVICYNVNVICYNVNEHNSLESPGKVLVARAELVQIIINNINNNGQNETKL